MVEAAPVCLPASPHKGASIVSGCASCAMHNHFYAWRCLLCGLGRAFYGWKRRCADVRAGTQAPPLPFLVWLHIPRLPEEALPMDKIGKRLLARCSPMDKNEGGCVAEGFDGGW